MQWYNYKNAQYKIEPITKIKSRGAVLGEIVVG